MRDGTSQSKLKKVKLYEERGQISRYIDAEITRDGDLVMTGQDLVKLPEEYWEDSDYEFFIYVPAKNKKVSHRVFFREI